MLENRDARLEALAPLVQAYIDWVPTLSAVTSVVTEKKPQRLCVASAYSPSTQETEAEEY